MWCSGSHVICASLTREFLEFSKGRGNDLMSKRGSFPGLKEGDRWCLCASRWKEAYDYGVAPKVILEATHSNALEFVTMEQLRSHALSQ